jgi:AcrR family transcriptional regulator
MSSMEDLKSQVVSKSLTFLEKDEIQSLSLRKIASQIGVTHQAPYHYFKSKKDLIEELQLHAYRELTQRYEKILLNIDEPGRAFQSLGIEYINLCIKRPGYFKAISVQNGEGKELKSEIKKCVGIMDTIIRRFTQSSNKGISAEKLKVTCWSCGHGFSSLYLNGQISIPKNKLRNYIEEYTQFLTDLIR